MIDTRRLRKLTLCSLTCIAAAALTACGGGGGSDNENADDDDDHNSNASAFITTTVMDGLLSNALVCVDVNANGLCDVNEPQARSASNGTAVLNVSGLNLASMRLLAVVGTDAVDADFGRVTQAYTLQTPSCGLSPTRELCKLPATTTSM